jgi:dopamine beta-monooxygenase
VKRHFNDDSKCFSCFFVVALLSFCVSAGIRQPLIYPEAAGLPIGGKSYSRYVMLEVHYNNPGRRDDWIDSSGLKLYYTDHLRKFDVGVLEIGLEYTDKNSIPPSQSPFDMSSFCVSECTRIGLPEKGITIFASQLHTHLTGVRVWTKHVRGGSEMPELNRDNHYSQHFQEIRILKHPVQLLPGDALINYCRYDTSTRTNVTLGGFAIREEMCVNYLHYYPKSDLEVCKSSIDTRFLRKYFGYMRDFESDPTTDDFGVKGIADNYRSIHWSPNKVRTLKKMYDNAPLSMQCNRSSGQRFPVSIPVYRSECWRERLCVTCPHSRHPFVTCFQLIDSDL